MVMDDEKYFCFTNTNMSGNDGYYTDDKCSVPNSVRFNQMKEKFEMTFFFLIGTLLKKKIINESCRFVLRQLKWQQIYPCLNLYFA
jgi:hypothetical protein